MMKKNLVIAFLLILGIFLISCSGFEKILKSKDYDFKYKKALEYYEKGDHYRYTTIFEQLSPIYSGTQRADTVEFYYAMGNYKQGDFILAGHYFDKFRKTYPRSVFTEEAEYMYAYCYYESSPRPELDQDNTQAAIMAFSEFLAKYPRTDKGNKVNGLLVELREKLVEKAYLSAKLYYTVSEYKAAIVALKNSIKDYPYSKHKEEQLYLVLKSSYLLADNSVPEKRRERFQATVDEYYTLVGEFPETQYLKDAKRIYDASMKILGN
ncbi:MAG: outer membrane protein assembly factor BamD [Tenuifilaceae bacterium]